MTHRWGSPELLQMVPGSSLIRGVLGVSKAGPAPFVAVRTPSSARLHKVDPMTSTPLRAFTTPPPVVVVEGVRMRLVDAPLACCTLELVAALETSSELVVDQPEGEVDLNVLVVSGTVTNRLAPAVKAAFEALPEPRRVVAFGACAVGGGPYWDSYSVHNGAGTQVPVDVFVPGCPPQPSALVAGLRVLVGGES